MKPIIALAAVLTFAVSAQAKEAAPLAEDPVVEQRLVKIAEELRCLVCQNESLAGSQAELAKDLRDEVRNLIKSGKSDEEVKDFLVSRYGDFVLYRPPVKPITYLLWVGPFLLLLAALVGFALFLRRRAARLAQSEQRPLSEEERKRAEALLEERAS